MNLSFYTATTGAIQQQDRLNVHGNNISNVNTYGFKAKVPSFSQLITQNIEGVTEDLPRGVGARLEAAATNTSGSAFMYTDLGYDYAIEGDGFFKLYDSVTGTVEYTRDGSFTKSSVETTNANGETELRWYLCDGNGRFVLDQDSNIIDITDSDPLNTEAIGIFTFENYDGILSEMDNMFTSINKNGDEAQGTGKLVKNALEMSNVDLAYELSKVIETQRSYSMLLKMITASDEIETTVNNLR